MPSRLPWVKFYFSDFEADTRGLSTSAAGGWIRILAYFYMKNEPTGEATKPVHVWSNIMGSCSEKETLSIFEELAQEDVAGVTVTQSLPKCDKNVTERAGCVTVTCRRIAREYKATSGHALRQQRYRDRHKSDGGVTEQRSEVRGQKSESVPDPKKDPPQVAAPIDIPKRNKQAAANAAALVVYDYHVERLSKALGRQVKWRATKGLLAKIKTRLKTFSIEDCKRAVDNLAVSPHNLGDNDNGREYCDPTFLFRTDEQVNIWMAKEKHEPGGKEPYQGPQFDPDRCQHCKREFQPYGAHAAYSRRFCAKCIAEGKPAGYDWVNHKCTFCGKKFRGPPGMEMHLNCSVKKLAGISPSEILKDISDG